MPVSGYKPHRLQAHIERVLVCALVFKVAALAAPVYPAAKDGRASLLVGEWRGRLVQVQLLRAAHTACAAFLNSSSEYSSSQIAL